MYVCAHVHVCLGEKGVSVSVFSHRKSLQSSEKPETISVGNRNQLLKGQAFSVARK